MKAKRMPISSIRDYLLGHPSSPYDYWVDTGRRLPYHRVLYYYWVLEKLGLIEVEREVPSSRGGVPKKVYRLAVGVDPEDERWYSPQRALYPQSARRR